VKIIKLSDDSEFFKSSVLTKLKKEFFREIWSEILLPFHAIIKPSPVTKIS
jgi:hypothetical protein